MYGFKIIFVLSIFYLVNSINCLKREECEVCFSVIGRLKDRLTDEHRKDAKLIETEFIEICKTTIKSNHSDKVKENTFCYYLGGLEESDTGSLKQLSQPLTYNFPVDKLCARLSDKIGGICALRYDKDIDLKTVELKKLKVRDLKKILNNWGEDCEGCLEKVDFIKRIETLKPQYVKDEL